MEVHFTSRFICVWMVIHSALATISVGVQPLEPSTKVATENLSRQARDSSYYRDERPADRDRDRYYNQNYYYYRPGSNNRGYCQSSRGGYEDRNWYYQPDLYDERNRYSGAGVERSPGYYDNRYDVANRYDVPNRYDDRYVPNRYDDRYKVRPLGPSSQYDRFDTQYGTNYRGNGYDNTDPNYYYEQSRRDPYAARERPYGGSNNRDYGYDGYRTGNRGAGIGYDQRNFRPWDESYRGTSGFDNSGRGYYFANKQAKSPHSQPTPQPFRPSFTPTQNPPTQHNNPNHHPYESSSSSGNNGKGSYNNHNGTGANSNNGNRGDDTSNGYANNDRKNGQNYRKDQDTQSEPMFSSKNNKQRSTSTSSTMTTESYCTSVLVLMSITTDQITIGRHS